MLALKTILAGGVAVVALASAAPASAQYYPGPGYGYGNGGVIGEVINSVIGGGYGYNGNGYNRYGNSQYAINQCVGAVQQRLSGGYGYNNGYQPYGYGNYGGAYGGGRVLGISEVEPRSNGGLTVRGVANSGRTAAYGYGYNNGQLPVDLTFRCKTDAGGYIVDVDIERAQSRYGYNPPAYTPYNYDYSQYGYRRY